jgi:hypothetical protein
MGRSGGLFFRSEAPGLLFRQSLQKRPPDLPSTRVWLDGTFVSPCKHFRTISTRSWFTLVVDQYRGGKEKRQLVRGEEEDSKHKTGIGGTLQGAAPFINGMDRP